MSFDLSFGTKSKSLTFELKQAIHGRKTLTCTKNRTKIDKIEKKDPSMRLDLKSPNEI